MTSSGYIRAWVFPYLAFAVHIAANIKYTAYEFPNMACYLPYMVCAVYLTKNLKWTACRIPNHFVLTNVTKSEASKLVKPLQF